ncbi:MAG: hypothetical protein JWN04_998, partial [Myxococcaceae bacterium]|nr:hypothetical protein [Myxococcaceae bacterium]
MGSDFSALDAELDTLETGPSVDALTLARTYAGASLELRLVDSALNEIDADGTLLRTRSSFPPEMPRQARKSERPQLGSEEIVLPDPVLREPQHRTPGSGEMPLHAAAERSGSFSLEQQPARSAKHSGRDDTLEPFDDELIEADEAAIEFTAAPASPEHHTGERRTSSLFETKSLVD